MATKQDTGMMPITAFENEDNAQAPTTSSQATTPGGIIPIRSYRQQQQRRS
jgi:hypothetical protein